MPTPIKQGKLFMKDASGSLVQIIPQANVSVPSYTGATSSAAGSAGLVPAAQSSEREKFLRGDGTWQETSSGTSDPYQGATASASGVAGLVPAAQSSEREKFLRGDGSWEEVSTAKEVAILTEAPTSQNTTSLDNQGFIFEQTSTVQGNPAIHVTGNETIAGVKTFTSTISGSIDGNAGTADAFSEAKNVTLTGDVTGTVSSTGGWTVPATLANSGVSAGTYRSVTVDAKGRVTAGTNPSTLSGYGITDAKIDNGTITLGSSSITPLTSTSTLDASKVSGTLSSSVFPSETFASYSHSHVGTEVSMTGYAKAGSASAVAASDTVNSAIGKIEAGLDAKAADSAVIHNTGNESAAGNKTFSGNVSVGGNLSVTGNPTCGADEIVHIPNTAESHNCIYRGKDLTNVYTLNQLSEKLADGDFSDLFIGDYITRPFSYSNATINKTVTNIQINFRFAHFNYWLQKGYKETANTFGVTTQNHIVLVPDSSLGFTSYMNATNTTEGGVPGSWLWTELQSGIYSAVNASTCLDGHVLGHSNLLPTTVNTTAASGACSAWTGASTAWAWKDEYLMLMSEVQAYGSRCFSSSGYDVGARNSQLALFRIDPSWLNSKSARYGWWLGAVASSASFCYVSGSGGAGADSASVSVGVRPCILFS